MKHLDWIGTAMWIKKKANSLRTKDDVPCGLSQVRDAMIFR